MTRRSSHSSRIIQCNTIHALLADASILGGRRSTNVTVQIGSCSFRSYAFPRGEVAICVIPANQMSRLGLGPGDRVDFEVAVRLPNLDRHLPEDLRLALEVAGVSLQALRPRDRYQMVRMIQESSSPEVRAARIAAAVAACERCSQETYSDLQGTTG